MGHGHDHGGTTTGATSGGIDAARNRALWIALVLNGGFLLVEIGGGIAFGSLALLADAAHMASDVAGLVIALVAQSLITRPPTARHSYGLRRAEVLGSQINAVLLVAASGWIIYEAIGRFGQPVDVEGGGMLVVATLGLLVNVVSAVAIARVSGRSLNMRAAFVHMASDAAGSVAAIAAAVAIIVWGADWVDAAASILISVLVLAAAWGLLRDATSILLESTPKGLHADDVAAGLLAEPEVEAVHHVHLWNLGSEETAMSAHVVLGEEPSLHAAQVVGERLKATLAERYGIGHATLELECHPCDPADDEPTRPNGRAERRRRSAEATPDR